MTDDAAKVGRILLVGGGNMGGALLGGWLEGGVDPGDVVVVDPAPSEALLQFAGRGVRHSAAASGEPADVVVLAVKPQSMSAVLAGLSPALQAGTLVLSIAAGTTVAAIEAVLGERPVVRAMPNTPALVGRGIAGCWANGAVTPAQRQTATRLLRSAGAVEWVENEAQIDMVTAVSGSGPAYVFLLTEALAEAGAALGLDTDLAMRLARHTVAGAGELMMRSAEPPATLRRNVTSPKGTTEAALLVLDGENGMRPLLERAVAAARRRAKELSEG